MSFFIYFFFPPPPPPPQLTSDIFLQKLTSLVIVTSGKRNFSQTTNTKTSYILIQLRSLTRVAVEAATKNK